MQKILIGFGILLSAVVGALVGAAASYLYWTTIPVSYSAQSLIEVVRSQPVDGRLNRQGPNAEIIDHSLVMRSQQVLGNAVDNGRLSDYSEFRGIDRNAIIAQLMNSENLIIEQVESTANAYLINLSFTCGDEELSATCVNAIVGSFQGYHDDSEESQITVTELIKPSVGAFSGPLLLPYLVVGATVGSLLAVALALLLFWRSDRG